MGSRALPRAVPWAPSLGPLGSCDGCFFALVAASSPRRLARWDFHAAPLLAGCARFGHLFGRRFGSGSRFLNGSPIRFFDGG
jgi:hypothetical protein